MLRILAMASACARIAETAGGLFARRVLVKSASACTPAAKMPIARERADQCIAEHSGPVKQSRAMSLLEALANVAVGFLLALATQMAIFPVFGLVVSFSDNLVIGSIFTAVSILRSFMLRRLFEGLRHRKN
jgi:hypothetical protein